ncbi:MAG TPA: OmpA family protein [Methylocella sp.]|nr:OmpA family protein [Methylocella sp.]
METFDRLIHDISSRYHLGPKGRALVENALDMITEQPGGINGFLQKFRSAGLAEYVASWQAGSDPIPLSGQKVEETLGSDAIKDIATRAGVSQRFARTILGYAIPKIIHSIAQKGFLEVAEVAAPLDEVVPLEPHPIYSEGELSHSSDFEETAKPWLLWPAGQAVTRFSRQLIIPGIASVSIIGLFGYLLLTSTAHDLRPPKTVTASSAPSIARNAPSQAMPSLSAHSAATPPSTHAQTALTPAYMSISNQNGLITYSGIVRDEATRTAVIDSLKAVFGPDKISGDLTLDEHFGPAAWTKDLRATLDNFKTAGSQVRFEGDWVSVGGTIPDTERGRIIAALKSTLGPNFTIAPMSSALTASASQAPKSSAAQTSASVPEQPTLHLPVIYFATNSALVPPDSKAILEREATQMKKLPVGTVVQIEGFTDGTGNPTFNMKLSQRRANAVRQVLIEAGVNPSLLSAKGNGIYNSAANQNSTGKEGRSIATMNGNQAADRRVEFHISQT